MKDILRELFNHHTLSEKVAYNILGDISDGKYSNEEVSAFLTCFNMRSISLSELTGFRNCLLDRCIKIDLSEFDAIDLCGTGGDGKDTFNISTLASFVVAGAGYKVAKHGNYGVSSTCGSSNVMEELGFNFTNESSVIKDQIDKSGITFLHAPLFHPAMKAVAPVRRQLGVRTFFNMLGPMVNPAQPKYQIVGVFSLELQRYYHYIYEQSDKHFKIIHALDGYDEISLTDRTRVSSNHGDEILDVSDFNFEKIAPKDLFGGRSVGEAADIFTKILKNCGTAAQKSVVIANAALAIQCIDEGLSRAKAISKAEESLVGGGAYKTLQKLLSI